MQDTINAGRRRFLGAAGVTIATAGFGMIEAGAARPGQARSFGALKQIDAGVLNIGYAEVGPTAGCECRTASREEESRKGVIEEH